MRRALDRSAPPQRTAPAADAPPHGWWHGMAPSAAWSGGTRGLTTFVLALLLAACTGTQEGGRPVLLVVATTDQVGLVAVPRDATEPLVWLDGAEQPLPSGGTVVDLVVARSAGPDGTASRIHVVTRVDGSDTLHVYDATAVPVEAPATSPLDTVDLDVLAPDLLADGLCTTAFDVSDDGRWLALVHEPEACETPGDEQTIVLLDLEADAGDENAWPFPGGDFVAPTFSPVDDALYFFDDAFGGGGRVMALPIPYASGQPREVALVDVDPFRDFGLGGAGRFVVAASNEIVTLDLQGDDEPVRQESATGVTAVIDAAASADAAAVVLAGDRLVVHRDVTAEGDDVEPFDSVLVTRLVDAVVGPDAFAHALGDGSIVVVDLLTYLADPDARATVANRTTLPELDGAVAIDWVYGAFPEAEANGF